MTIKGKIDFCIKPVDTLFILLQNNLLSGTSFIVTIHTNMLDFELLKIPV